MKKIKLPCPNCKLDDDVRPQSTMMQRKYESDGSWVYTGNTGQGRKCYECGHYWVEWKTALDRLAAI